MNPAQVPDTTGRMPANPTTITGTPITGASTIPSTSAGAGAVGTMADTAAAGVEEAVGAAATAAVATTNQRNCNRCGRPDTSAA